MYNDLSLRKRGFYGEGVPAHAGLGKSKPNMSKTRQIKQDPSYNSFIMLKTPFLLGGYQFE